MPEVVGRLRTPRLATAPDSPAVGEMYYDTGLNKLFWWNGSGWLPATGGDIVYNGAFPTNTPYTPGDIVVQGTTAYLAVKATSAPPTAWPSNPGIPTVVNGQFLKGSGGAAIWSPITAADIAPAVGGGHVFVNGPVGAMTGPWPKTWPAITLPFKANVLLTVNATCYSGGIGVSGMIPQWDGANLPLYGDFFFNEANSHKLCMATNVILNVAAGSHTVGVTTSGTTSDSGDRASYSLIAMAVP